MDKQTQVDGAVGSEVGGSGSVVTSTLTVGEAFALAGTPAYGDSEIWYGADFTQFSGEPRRDIWVCLDVYPYVWCDAEDGASAGWYRNKWITPLGDDVSDEPALKWWDKFPVGIQLALPALAALSAPSSETKPSEQKAVAASDHQSECPICEGSGMLPGQVVCMCSIDFGEAFGQEVKE